MLPMRRGKVDHRALQAVCSAAAGTFPRRHRDVRIRIILTVYIVCYKLDSIDCSVLSLFTIVQWGQSLCQAPSGEYGTCVPNNECAVRGGIPGGPCAEGYGMCCVCEYTCWRPLHVRCSPIPIRWPQSWPHAAASRATTAPIL